LGVHFNHCRFASSFVICDVSGFVCAVVRTTLCLKKGSLTFLALTGEVLCDFYLVIFYRNHALPCNSALTLPVASLLHQIRHAHLADHVECGSNKWRRTWSNLPVQLGS